MKKLLIGLFLLLWALAACTAGGDVPPTNTETAPNATPEEAAVTEVEATATTETKPTETATPTDEPEPTVEPTRVPTAVPTATEAPRPDEPTGDGYPAPPLNLPEGVVIVFTQTGGFAGFDDTWTFYSDGKVMKNGGEVGQISSDDLNDLLDTLEDLNFFETSYETKETICCDFFNYTLAVESGDKQNFVSFSDGDENVPQNLREAVAAVLAMIMRAQER
jgi:hypothetical protein